MAFMLCFFKNIKHKYQILWRTQNFSLTLQKSNNVNIIIINPLIPYIKRNR